MKNAMVAMLMVFALLLAGCTKTNNDQKPVYLVPLTVTAA